MPEFRRVLLGSLLLTGCRFAEPVISAGGPTPRPGERSFASPGQNPLQLTTLTSETRDPELPLIRVPGLRLQVLAGSGQAGFKDGKAQQARFNSPASIVSDGSHFYIADAGNHSIRKMSREGEVTTLVGGQEGIQPGDFGQVRFTHPYRLWLVSADLLYVLDRSSMIYALDLKKRQVELLAYSQKVFSQSSFYRQDLAHQARFAYPGKYSDFAFRDGYFYVNDLETHNLKRFNLEGEMSVVAGLSHDGHSYDERGYFDLKEFWVAKDGSPDQAVFRAPGAMQFNQAGDLILVDDGQIVRKLEAGTSLVSTLMGRHVGLGVSSYRDGKPDQAGLAEAYELALAPDQTSVYLTTGTGLRLIRQNTIHTLIQGLAQEYLCLTPEALLLTDREHHRIYRMPLDTLTSDALARLEPILSGY